jgi:hypothetical protein
VKAHNEKTGNSRLDWEHFERLNGVFGARQNISPDCLIDSEEMPCFDSHSDASDSFSRCSTPSTLSAKLAPKLEKTKSPKGDALAVMLSERSRIQQQTLELEKERLELMRETSARQHEIELKKIELDQEKFRATLEQMRAENEQRKQEIDLKMKKFEFLLMERK